VSESKNPTIADFIRENGIQETPVEPGDPNAPSVNLPIPEGWDPGGETTPDGAYGSIVYIGTDAGHAPPRIIASFSKLTGNVDAQRILDLASGELRNLPGYESGDEGEASTLAGYSGYQLGGTYESEGGPVLVAQKTVVVPGPDCLYVLQLNAYAIEEQADILTAATGVIDETTTITV
jgi:Probable lipoprotein LpqN